MGREYDGRADVWSVAITAIEMAETRPAELPGSVTGGDADEEENEEDLRARMEEAVRARERAEEAAALLRGENEGLRRRNVKLEEEGGAMRAELGRFEVEEERRRERQREVDGEQRELLGERGAE